MKPSCMSGTHLYEIWRGMKKRCEVPTCKDWPQYGGRGITICEDWSRSFRAFMDWAWDNGYTVDRSLDRIDVDRGYCPDNCRWAHYQEQQLNTQKTSKIYTNIRLRNDRMKVLLATLPDDAVVTVICRRDLLPEKMHAYLATHQDKDPAIPADKRKDAPRSKGTRPRKALPQFIDDLEASFSGDF